MLQNRLLERYRTVPGPHGGFPGDNQPELAWDRLTVGILWRECELLAVWKGLEESFQDGIATRVDRRWGDQCISRAKGNSKKECERWGAQAGSTCYRVRCLAATRDCWGCGWHPGHHRHRGPTIGKHLSTPVGSTGTGSAPGSAHPSGSESGHRCGHVHMHTLQCVYTHLQSSGWYPQTRLAHTVQFPPRLDLAL